MRHMTLLFTVDCCSLASQRPRMYSRKEVQGIILCA